jgi:hypothetical protein
MTPFVPFGDIFPYKGARKQLSSMLQDRLRLKPEAKKERRHYAGLAAGASTTAPLRNNNTTLFGYWIPSN